MTDRVAVRDATAADISAVADVLRRSTRAAYTFLAWTHDDASFEDFVRNRFPAWSRVRVIERNGRIVGFACLEQGALDQLFVLPEEQGRGVGSALVEDAKGLCPEGFTLYTFRANERARRFYAGHGLVETGFGVSEAEGEPDVSLDWRPHGR